MIVPLHRTLIGAVRRFAVLLALMAGLSATAEAGAPFITVASTTSTDNSGLLDEILPKFRAASGADVRVVAVGTGQAIRLARSGDADVLMVHDRESEERFVADGFGVERHALMHNDFIIVGPKDDPANLRGMNNVGNALAAVADREQPFASRGDDSGTHKAELRMWELAERDPRTSSGKWYRETGSGMGATLNTAAAMGAYAFVDRGTWLAFKNRVDLELLVTGDPRLQNPYSVILVNPEQHPHVKAKEGQAFIDWLLSKAGQAAIGDFRVNGEVLFIPDAL
ncbi:MAG: substrate-binding domain-containing protein [Myxococcales bacterium]